MQNLREVRELAGLSVECCCSEFGVSPDTWRAWEDGSLLPSVSLASLIAGFFCVSLGYLLEGSSESVTFSESSYRRCLGF